MEKNFHGLIGGCVRGGDRNYSNYVPPIMIAERYEPTDPRIILEWSPREPDTKVEDKPCNNLRLVYTGSQYEVQFLSTDDESKAPTWDYVNNDLEAFELLSSAIDHLIFLEKAKQSLIEQQSLKEQLLQEQNMV